MADLDSDNVILRKDQMYAIDNQVMMHPSITINNITYTGDSLNGREMMMAICDAYREAPDECQLAYMIKDRNHTKVDWEGVEMPDDPDLLFQGGVRDSKENYWKHKKIERMHIIAIIVIIIAVNLVVLAVVRCRMKRQMS